MRIIVPWQLEAGHIHIHMCGCVFKTHYVFEYYEMYVCYVTLLTNKDNLQSKLMKVDHHMCALDIYESI